jgi:hypothetical protein
MLQACPIDQKKRKNSKCKEMQDIICCKDVNREVRAFSPEGMKQDHANQ